MGRTPSGNSLFSDAWVFQLCLRSPESFNIMMFSSSGILRFSRSSPRFGWPSRRGRTPGGRTRPQRRCGRDTFIRLCSRGRRNRCCVERTLRRPGSRTCSIVGIDGVFGSLHYSCTVIFVPVVPFPKLVLVVLVVAGMKRRIRRY